MSKNKRGKKWFIPKQKKNKRGWFSNFAGKMNMFS